MDISMLTTWRISCGIAHYAERLVNELQSLVNVEVVPIEPRLRSGADALRHYAEDARYYRSLGEQLNRGDVAHVQHQYVFFGGVAPHRAKFAHVLSAARVPVVLTVHEVDEGSGFKSFLVQRLNRQSFLHPQVRLIIVHSEPLAESLRRVGVPAERISILPMPIPSSKNPPPPTPPTRGGERRQQTSRSSWEGLGGQQTPLPLWEGSGEGKNKTVLTIFGFIVARKGYDVALRALRELPEEFVLLIAGGKHFADRTGYVEELQADIRRLGLEKRVRITGYLQEEELAQAMSATDIALAPFHSMSASASVAELLGHGKPVIASDLPPLRALAQEVGSITLFAAGDGRELVERIRQVARQQTEGTVVLPPVKAGYSFRELAEATADIYRRVVST
jgi:glycosyltransferase involved in cell wall biosynthesis